jgi:hypothetical protein
LLGLSTEKRKPFSIKEVVKMIDLTPHKRQIQSHATESQQEINNIYGNFLNSDLPSSTMVTSALKNDLKNSTEFKTEKRRYARHQVQQEVTCTFYDSLKDDFEILDARVLNKSNSGILLTTDLPLEIGMPVLVRLKHFTETDVHDELKDGLHAQVVRCDEIFFQEKESLYQVAIEHFEG